jgi:hypothetical protein
LEKRCIDKSLYSIFNTPIAKEIIMAKEKTKEQLAAEEKALKAKRSEKSKESRGRRLAAIQVLIDFIGDQELDMNDYPEVQKAIARLSGNLRASTGTTKRDVILEYVTENQPVHENDIFTNFQLGRMEMRSICNDLIKKVSAPADRVWIGFDPESGEYAVKGKGAKAPKGWTGYTPVEVESVKDEEDDDDEIEE